MRRLFSLILVLIPFIMQSGEVFYYSSPDGNGGLRFAIKDEKGQWGHPADNFTLLTSDFGAWGSGKKMFDPLIIPDKKEWKVAFSVNKEGTVYGVAVTKDFIHWKPQEYFLKEQLNDSPFFTETSHETIVLIGDKNVKGRIINIDDEILNRLLLHIENKNQQKQLYSERATDDHKRFEGLHNVKATLKVYSQSKEISPILYGIFFEDINYAADGGLYGELIQNRDFEYAVGENKNSNWNSMFGWSVDGRNILAEIREEDPISRNNPHYIHLSVESDASDNPAGLINEGFDGISLKKDGSYHLNVMARCNVDMPLKIELLNCENQPVASDIITISPTNQWTDYSCSLKVKDNYSGSKLKITPLAAGTLDLDMISLFPEDTFKGRKNGLRADLAQTISNLKPQFVRFPGGCVAHGNGLDNIYDWKGSIGPLEHRKPLPNLWGYHQTRGLGYFEYFQFCEDIGAEPVPVIAAGVCCQNSDKPSKYTMDDLTLNGQQQGLPLDSMDSYIRDILDLIEYANGPVTSKWGSKRADAGHPEPFNLKYIGIGNEDLISEAFKTRFSMIQEALKKEYPEIKIIGTVGPFYEGSDYEEGWNFAREKSIDMVDEHYYVEPGWLIYNQNYYDDYDRDDSKVYLGEWAAHIPGRDSTMETALAEAIYITALERNADVVEMASYAPLLAKKNHTQWRPDLIYFDNDSVYLTTDYHVMKLAGENAGTRYLKNKLDVNQNNEKVNARIGASVVINETGETIIKLVNILPTSVDLKLDLREIIDKKDIKGKMAKTTTMTGQPDQTIPNIKESSGALSGQIFDLTVPEYSFTILRF